MAGKITEKPINPSSRYESGSAESKSAQKTESTSDFNKQVFDAFLLVSSKYEELNAKFEDQKKILEQDIDDIKANELTELKGSVDTLKKQTEDSIDNLSQKETRLIETLGVFFALFTFISINVQIFSRINDLFTGVVFSVLIFTLLGLMLVLFHFLLMYQENRSFIIRHSVLFSVLLFFALVCVAIFSNNNKALNPTENTESFNSSVDKRIIEKLNSEYYTKDELDRLIPTTETNPINSSE